MMTSNPIDHDSSDSGSAQHYAAALDLPTLPPAGAAARVTLVTSGIGAIGLVVLAQASFPLAAGDETLVVRLWMLISLAGMVVTIALIPRVIPWIVRARRFRLWLVACGLPFVCWGPFALIVYQGQLILFTLPPVPIAIGAAVLLLAPPIFNQVRHTFQDDPIIEPGGDPEPRPTRVSRVLYVGANWIMVVYGAISFVLTFALYPSN
ncbi:MULTISPECIES: hypothetical protein [unclassified Cryobacterium]|uniref:hypothetical protein n=1 Tax=unclassified Cryobacterium TaxID=2649013 RepID=UPI00106A3E97|nr:MULTISPECIES: hypothetical protein [unclassified Cryobacterium]TFD07720.1 hypothetical protein E3T29_07560 [Cryobacterium sp. TMT1-66-1]TFD07995.1 hypothetical protein E3T35_18540 [Cryobacterium sp. TMT1-2-2]